MGHQLVELSVLQQELLVLLPGQGYPPHLRLHAGDGRVALLDGGQGLHVHHNQHHSGHKEQEQPFLPPSSDRHHDLPAAGCRLPELRGQQKVGKKVTWCVTPSLGKKVTWCFTPSLGKKVTWCFTPSLGKKVTWCFSYAQSR